MRQGNVHGRVPAWVRCVRGGLRRSQDRLVELWRMRDQVHCGCDLSRWRVRMRTTDAVVRWVLRRSTIRSEQLRRLRRGLPAGSTVRFGRLRDVQGLGESVRRRVREDQQGQVELRRLRLRLQDDRKVRRRSMQVMAPITTGQGSAA